VIKTFFKHLAEKENGIFQYEDSKAYLGGTANPYVTFRLQFHYKGHHFQITNVTGTEYVGNFLCTLKSDLQVVDFEIDSISHFKNLFVRRKQRLRVTSKNENVVYFLEQNESLKQLREIGKEEKFSPRIICSSKDRTIETQYHLEFDDWHQVIEPLIQLHKDVIDEFEKNRLKSSPRAYQEALNSQ
jgi:hypothetical protein